MVILKTDSARQTSRTKKLRKAGSEITAFEPTMFAKIDMLWAEESNLKWVHFFLKHPV